MRKMLKESLLLWIDRPPSNSDLDMINMLVKNVQNWNDLKIKLEDIAKIEYNECNMESYNVYSHILKLMNEMENGQN
jgi:hypothetical protein